MASSTAMNVAMIASWRLSAKRRRTSSRIDAPVHPARVRHDPVPLQRVDVVDLLVEEPPLELADVLLALFGVGGPSLLLVELVERAIDVAAVVRRADVFGLELVEVEVGIHRVAALEVGGRLEVPSPQLGVVLG